MQVRSHALGDIPRRSARRCPDKVAVVDGDVRLTFAEFDELVDRAAAALRDNGFTPGDRIALLAHNCWQYAVLAFATARAAVVLVPINFMLTAEEIAYILGHSQRPRFDRRTRPHSHRRAGDGPSGGDVTTRVALTTGGQRAPAGWDDFALWLTTTTPAPDLEVDDDQLLRLMYTSGTESRPKGVMHSSRSLMSNYVSTIIAGVDVGPTTSKSTRCRCTTARNWTTSWPPTSTSVPPASSFRAPNPRRSCAASKHIGDQLLCPTDSLDRPAALAHIRRGRPVAACARATTAHRQCRPRSCTRSVSGCRTCSCGTSTARRRWPRWPAHWAPPSRATTPARRGGPRINVETTILDDTDTPGPAGTVGEIAHRGPHLMLGYLDDPVRTAEAFRGGWFHSGDLGYYDEFGLLHVVDRKKDMIKTGGENVASREVEEVLYRHPARAGSRGVRDPASAYGSRPWWRLWSFADGAHASRR